MKINKRFAAVMMAGLMTVSAVMPAMANPADGSQNAQAQTLTPDMSAMNVICAPSGIMILNDGTLIVSDTYNKVIWKTKDRVSTIFAGAVGVTDLYGEPIGGYNDGKVSESYFKKPWAVTPFINGIAVSDSTNNVVRFIGFDGTETAVGHGVAGHKDGYGMDTEFNNPTGLATDDKGNLYIADTNNNVIRMVTPGGYVSTFRTGLNEPTGLCWMNGCLYVAESGAHRILKLKNGKVVGSIGSGLEGDMDGQADQAQFSYPQGVTVTKDGTVYISDTGNGSVKKVYGGQVTTMIHCDNAKMDLYPVTPIGLAVYENKLYVCDNFSRKVLVLDK